ncbi:MAG: helix-turn-helix domain-containing protein [Chloroflexota bacterium]
MRSVKSPSGSLRAERAAVTRRRIAEAARGLFATRGYGATTLREIAAAAGVAVQTVYAVFGSKANILRELREGLVTDPAADAAFRAALDASSPPAALDLFARSVRLRWETGHDIVAIHLEAGSTDPTIRVEVEAVLSARRRGIGRLAGSVAGLEPSLDVREVMAVLDGLTLPEIYAELVGVHGWSAEAYESWLAEALRRLVLR